MKEQTKAKFIDAVAEKSRTVADKLTEVDQREYQRQRSSSEEFRYWMVAFLVLLVIIGVFAFLFISFKLGLSLNEVSLVRVWSAVISTATLATFAIWDVVYQADHARKPGLKPLSSLVKSALNAGLLACMSAILLLMVNVWMAPSFFVA